MTRPSKRAMPTAQPAPVQCTWCRKLFTAGGDMTCGATVPTNFSREPNGAWCKTDDIVSMLEVQPLIESA